MSFRARTQDQFFPQAKAMRREFDQKWKNPHEAGSERFVWDPWFVPEQYKLLRTPAYHFFSKKIYETFHSHLQDWGRENLGCHDISPSWLSVYTNGAYQRLHGDVPHGPFAFVFSLSPWTAQKGAPFRGGETVLLRDEILDYWNADFSGKPLESPQIFEKIPAFFNRLTVFDPRIPHGVEEVRGPEDIRDGRLVVHGWFTQPRPKIVGPIRADELQRQMPLITAALDRSGILGKRISGVMTYRLEISVQGAVKSVKNLANSLRGIQDTSSVNRALIATMKNLAFKKNRAPSVITLPLVFES